MDQKNNHVESCWCLQYPQPSSQQPVQKKFSKASVCPSRTFISSVKRVIRHNILCSVLVLIGFSNTLVYANDPQIIIQQEQNLASSHAQHVHESVFQEYTYDQEQEGVQPNEDMPYGEALVEDTYSKAEDRSDMIGKQQSLRSGGVLETVHPSSSSSSSSPVGMFSTHNFFSSFFSKGNEVINEEHPVMKKLDNIKSSLSQINPGNAGLGELHDVSAAMDLIGTLVSDPSFLSSIPQELQSSMQDILIDIRHANNAVRKIEELVSDYESGVQKQDKNKDPRSKRQSSVYALSSSSSQRQLADMDNDRKAEDAPIGNGLEESISLANRNAHEDKEQSRSAMENFDQANKRDRRRNDHSSTKFMKSKGYSRSKPIHSRFDYIHRTKNLHQRNGYFGSSSNFFSTPPFSSNMGSFEHPHGQGRYGYHQFRETHMPEFSHGKTKRRLMKKNDDDGGSNKVCTTYEKEEERQSQCERLAKCANHYSLYDLFVFYYQDDIDLDKGEFKDDEYKDTTFDEIDITARLKEIKDISGQILQDKNYDDDLCDNLLQKFHRFYDNIGEIGKWQGGSVTSVCRGWGTANYVKLGEIYDFLVTKTREFSRTSDVVIDMFEEFVNCTGTISDTSTLKMFDSGDPIRNPFVSDSSLLFLPVDIQTDIRDHHSGQIKKDSILLDRLFLSTIDTFKYVSNILGWVNLSNKLDVLPTGYLSSHSREVLKKSFEQEWYRDLNYDEEERILLKFAESTEIVWDNTINIRAKENDPLLDNFEFENGIIEFKGILDVPPGRTKLCFYHDDTLELKIDGSTKNTEGGKDEPSKVTVSDPGPYLLEMTYEDIDSHGTMFLAWYDKDQKCPILHGYPDKDNVFDPIKPEHIPQAEDWIDPYQFAGVSRYSFDRSIELLFGQKTTIGQVCSYAAGLENPEIDIDNAPGFCCLDAPYQNLYWGEQYSCVYEYDDGKHRRGEAKNIIDNPNVCKSVAPVTTGFNKDACDTFSGTWCPNARPCGGLAVCINKMRNDAKSDTSKKAFFEYLDGAPSLKNPKDVKECRDVRKYFDYDPDYPDDERICHEVEELQCLSDFSDLDGLSEAAESDEKLEDLVINTKIVQKSKEYYRSDKAKSWRIANFALRKSLETAHFIYKQIMNKLQSCDMYIVPLPVVGGTVPGSASICVAPSVIIGNIALIVKFSFTVALDISGFLYTEIVDKDKDGPATSDIRDATYENVITSSENIHTVFKAVQQVKQMLGEVGDNLLQATNEDNNQRRLTECDITNVSHTCFGLNDPRYKCDCSLDYSYIAIQQNAGCDEFDSDGDGIVDRCEDRFPPTLLLGDASIFRCDKDEPEKLCYSDEVFTEHQHAINFLKFQAKVSDDCAPLNSKMLGMDIDYIEGKCFETVYNITAWQNYSDCPNETVTQRGEKEIIPFTNPLYGTATEKQIFVRVDDEDPVMISGFNHDVSNTNVNDIDVLYSIKENTLYYYSSSSKTKGFVNSNFFYKIEDNCPADINVDITVKSNEYDHESPMIKIVKYEFSGFNTQAKIYYAATSCDISGRYSCEKDGTIAKPIRFYDIIATATDSSGRVGQDESRIIIVPKCDMKEKDAGICEKRGPHYYYKRQYASALARESLNDYKLISSSLIWKDDLASVLTAPPTASPAPTTRGKGGTGNKNEIAQGGFDPKLSATEVIVRSKDDPSAEYLHDSEFIMGILTPIVKTCKYLSNLEPSEIERKCSYEDSYIGYDPAFLICPETCESNL